MDPEKTWQKVLNIIKEETSAANFKTWFSQTQLKSIDEEKLVLVVHSAFIKQQLASRYSELIQDSLKKVLDKSLIIEYIVDPSIVSKGLPQTEEEYSPFENPKSQPISKVVTNLNPKYSINNFVVGLTNNLAFAAAQAVVANPGTTYNPLFIYGPSGVGKTHLMQAIGNAIVEKKPQTKLLYITSERFINDFVDAIQTKRTTQFRDKYRNIDLLLIDDIQFISGKDSTQEEFFHTFNELYSNNSQIILTSDRTPTEMQRLESRLLSRFQGGLMVDIQLPDFDTRVAILKAKLAERGESLPEEYLKIIAENTESSTRELEGKLILVLQSIKYSPGPHSEETITKLLGKPTSGNNFDQKKVLSTINQYFNTKMSDLIGPRRQKELVLPRQIAMFILYEDCKLPMEKIGEILGGRDHTTILHGIDKIRQAITRDREVQRLVIEVKQAITQ